MKKNKGSAGVGAPNRAGISVTEPLRNGYKDILSQLSPRTQELFKLLGQGKTNAISSAQLAAYFCTDQRGLRQIVRDARVEGLIICSGVDGYFLPTNREEVLKWYWTAHAKAISGLEPLKPARHYLELPEGQGNIAL